MHAATGWSATLGGGILAGVLHALALRFEWAWPLAGVAVVPLLLVVGRVSLWPTLGAAVAYTTTLFAVDVAPWLIAALARYFTWTPRATAALVWGAIALAGTGYGAVLGGALWLRRRSAGALGVVWCAALWAVWEHLRSIVPPYFPVSVLATSQQHFLPLFQLASLTGIAGVTAVLAGLNAAIAQLWMNDVSGRRRVLTLAAAGSAVLAATLWGAHRLATATSPASDAPRILMIDGNAASAGESTLERYIAAMPPLPSASPALVVWPESALPNDFERDRPAWERLRLFVDGLDVPLISGGTGGAIAADGSVVAFNSVHFLRPRHGMASYHKRLLVPLAESWPAALGASPIDPIGAGHDVAIFAADGITFGPLICFEITDGASARTLARQRARFIVNVNNDIWFRGWEAPHFVWARVRAVESGLPVVRATNCGTTAMIDAFGRVSGTVRASGGPAFLLASLPPPAQTAYAGLGDLFLPAAALVTIIGLLPRRRFTRTANRDRPR